jgi:membrane protease YdiL (CAAX protease family)
MAHTAEIEAAQTPDSENGGGNDIEPVGRGARWLLTGALFTAYLPLQIVFAVPFVIVAILSGRVQAAENPAALLESPFLLWATLVSAALAGAVTVALAAVWPWFWRLVSGRLITWREWFAWQKPRYIKLWMVPPITLPILVVVGLAVMTFFGPAEIQIQLDLFSTPALGAASTIVVSTVVPVAEELLFRGALYNALLKRSSPENPGWRRHILPVTVTALTFAAIHLAAGFETAAAIIQIVLLSAYLSLLRAVTGSVQANITAHAVWNALAALGLFASTYVNLPR